VDPHRTAIPGGFVVALSQDDIGKAAVDAALHVPRVMLLYRWERLAEEWPDELGDELASRTTRSRRPFGRGDAAAALAHLAGPVAVRRSRFLTFPMLSSAATSSSASRRRARLMIW